MKTPKKKPTPKKKVTSLVAKPNERVEPIEPTPQTTTGAGAALRALELRELEERNIVEQLKSRLDKARIDRDRKPPELDGTDFDREVGAAEYSLERAKSQHLVTSKALLAFDKSVSENKRDTGEKITWAEVERMLTMFAIYDRQAAEMFITSFCSQVLTCKTAEEIHKLFASEYKSTKSVAIESAVRENHLPLRVQTIIEGQL